MPEIDSGTIAAAVPIDVPTRMRVSGITATRKIMNGSERKPLTIAPTLPLTHRFSQNPPGAVPTRTSPSGRPTAKLIAPETTVITSVSPSEPRRRSNGRASMAEDLHGGAAEFKPTFDARDKVGRSSENRENDRRDRTAPSSKGLRPQDDRKGARLRGELDEHGALGQRAFEDDAKDGVEPGRPILAETCEPFPVLGVGRVVVGGRKEAACQRDLRIAEDCRHLALFDDASVIEHDDPAGDRPRHAHLVGDENDGEAELAVDVAQ